MFGLLLYVIYVNDYPNALNCITRLYVDDICLVISEYKANTLQKEISSNIHNLKVWLDTNELTLNLNEIACLIILHLIQIKTYI